MRENTQWAMEMKGGDDDAAARRANRQFWNNHLHEQIQRLFSEYRPSLLPALALQTRHSTLVMAEQVTMNYCKTLHRPLTDAEVEAFVKHYIRYSNQDAINKSAVFLGCAGWVAWPWVRRYFTTVNENYIAIPSELKFRLATRSVGRFCILYLVATLITHPSSEIYQSMRWSSEVKRDPILADLNRIVLKPRSGVSQIKATSNTNANTNQPVRSNNQETIEQKAKAGWSADGNSESWFDIDDLDASPTNPNLKKQTQSASPWDRLRQQTKNKPAKAQSTTDQQTRTASQNTDGWGGTTYEAGAKEQDQTRNAYGDSNSDVDVDNVKAQAQQEFDQLLERERRGIDQVRR
ncbi:hypothetical protein CDD82_6506 [Ophiocordyceps australis]|uniref:Uncharacterized protein n=1 Tax=Ophiocordyceps australis TaxID=1399860 RepID=A0A2C5YPI1_9HYPO|nr:hypothetical protein CDD82_6506 [Ophiocordyceps australis]